MTEFSTDQVLKPGDFGIRTEIEPGLVAEIYRLDDWYFGTIDSSRFTVDDKTLFGVLRKVRGLYGN